MSGPPQHRRLWIVPGVTIVVFCAALAYVGPRPDSWVSGVAGGAVAVLLLVAARWAWRNQAPPPAAPMSEFLAAVYPLGFWSVVLLIRWDREFSLLDTVIILPPLGVLPLLARLLSGDQRTPSNRGRRVARQLHLVIGWIFGGLGVLFVIALYFVVLAPLPIAAAALHLHAAARYDFPSEEGADRDPRLGWTS